MNEDIYLIYVSVHTRMGGRTSRSMDVISGHEGLTHLDTGINGQRNQTLAHEEKNKRHVYDMILWTNRSTITWRDLVKLG